MDIWLQTMLTIIGSVVASSGFWAILQKSIEKKDVKTIMLIGLAHDRIIFLGMTYIERGWLTHDEYENLDKYLYAPYQQMGGNGSAVRIMNEINKLPIHNTNMLLTRGRDNHERQDI